VPTSASVGLLRSIIIVPSSLHLGVSIPAVSIDPVTASASTRRDLAEPLRAAGLALTSAIGMEACATDRASLVVHMDRPRVAGMAGMAGGGGGGGVPSGGSLAWGRDAMEAGCRQLVLEANTLCRLQAWGGDNSEPESSMASPPQLSWLQQVGLVPAPGAWHCGVRWASVSVSIDLERCLSLPLAVDQNEGWAAWAWAGAW